MNVKKLKKNTEEIVLLLDLFDRVKSRNASDIDDKKAIEFKLNYIKKQLSSKIIESKNTCQHVAQHIKRQLK